MFDLVSEIMAARTEATGSNIQVLNGSGVANTAEEYVYPFKSGSEPKVLYSLITSGDATFPLVYIISGSYQYHALLASGTPSYNWIAIGERPSQ
jgi:hypothetical protein